MVEKVARGVQKSIGVIPPSALNKLDERNLMPQSAVITLRDTDVLHAMRDTKEVQLPIEVWRNITDYIGNPEAILLDLTQKEPSLLYIFSPEQDKGKVILRLDYSFKVRNPETGKKENIMTNVLRSGKPFVWNREMKDGFSQYEIILGEIK